MESSKARSDSWYAALSEEKLWAAYGQFRQHPWHKVARWMAEEYGIEAPSRSAIYRWAARMREMESAHRIEQAIAARDEAAAISAAAAPDDARLIDAYKALAADVVLGGGDAATAVRFTRMALDLAAAQTKRAELALKTRAQETKDRTLKLAQEKFDAAERRMAEAREKLADVVKGGGLSGETIARIEEAAKLL